MRLTFLYTKAMTVELLRYPAFSVPTLAFPGLFFLLFVASRDDKNATLLLASFAGFAFLPSRSSSSASASLPSARRRGSAS